MFCRLCLTDHLRTEDCNGRWYCSKCGYPVDSSRETCSECGHDRPEE